MSQLLLPKKDEEGNQYLSYSQIKNWNSLKSFNLSVLGKMEYILEYFFGEDFGDMGWAEFGQDVEDYITIKESANKFTDAEKKVMDSIKTLGVFQKEIEINFEDFYLKGFIDDMTEDFMHIRDYKSASDNSRKQYYKDDYWQLDVYGMWVKQEKGKLPEKADVVIVERAGNCFRGGGRKVLSVKNEVWYHDRELTEERQEILKNKILTTAQEISDAYKVFLKMKK